MSAHRDSNYIVVSRSWLVAGIVGVITFLAGVLIGYVVALTTYQHGINNAYTAFEEALAELPAPVVQADTVQQQPTAIPTRLDNVSADDDPYLGDENASIVIVEFSDFRCPYCGRFAAETLPALLELILYI